MVFLTFICSSDYFFSLQKTHIFPLHNLRYSAFSRIAHAENIECVVFYFNVYIFFNLLKTKNTCKTNCREEEMF